MGALGGLYRSTLQGYNVNLTRCWAQLSVSLASGFSADYWGPPTGPVRSRQDAPAAGGSGWWLITVAVLLVTQAWSAECGYSPTAWWEITIASPCLVWLMAHGLRGRSWLPARSRIPLGSTSQV